MATSLFQCRCGPGTPEYSTCTGAAQSCGRCNAHHAPPGVFSSGSACRCLALLPFLSPRLVSPLSLANVGSCSSPSHRHKYHICARHGATLQDVHHHPLWQSWAHGDGTGSRAHEGEVLRRGAADTHVATISSMSSHAPCSSDASSSESVPGPPLPGTFSWAMISLKLGDFMSTISMLGFCRVLHTHSM